jgi:radical SAM protein with 4Fe4S-binding SPASM domain
MSTEEIKNAIVKLQNEVEIENIGLSGGEPTLREDLPEILSFLKERDISAIVVTNGTLLTDELVNKIADKSLFEITLLSYRREIHDKLAGREGAWDEAVKGMARIKRAGGTFIAVFVATKLNYMDLQTTIDLAIALGAKGLMYNRLNISAHNSHYAEELLPTPEMIQENLDSLENLGKEYGLPIAVSVVVEPCVVDIEKYQHVQICWCPLGGEESYFTIDPVGNIRICNHSPVILGNIRRDSFIDIYNNHPQVRAIQSLPDECQNCNSKFKELCCGGCKASSEQCYGTMNHADPFVELSKIHSTHQPGGGLLPNPEADETPYSVDSEPQESLQSIHHKENRL